MRRYYRAHNLNKTSPQTQSAAQTQSVAQTTVHAATRKYKTNLMLFLIRSTLSDWLRSINKFNSLLLKTCKQSLLSDASVTNGQM